MSRIINTVSSMFERQTQLPKPKKFVLFLWPEIERLVSNLHFFSLRRVKKLTPVKLLLGRNGKTLPRLENLINFGLRRQQSTLISSLACSTLSQIVQCRLGMTRKCPGGGTAMYGLYRYVPL